MAGLELHGSWHCVSSIFAIFAILRSMERPASDYHSSLVFINETGQNVSQVPLLVNKMMLKGQHLTYMFNMRYGCFLNQLIS